MLAQSFRVQGIPAVKAFRDGRIVDEFTGALPPAEVERFFDTLVPSEADELAGSGRATRSRCAVRSSSTRGIAGAAIAPGAAPDPAAATSTRRASCSSRSPTTSWRAASPPASR